MNEWSFLMETYQHVVKHKQAWRCLRAEVAPKGSGGDAQEGPGCTQERGGHTVGPRRSLTAGSLADLGDEPEVDILEIKLHLGT